MRRRDDPPIDDRLRQAARQGAPTALIDLDELDDCLDDVALGHRLRRALHRLTADESQRVIKLLPRSMIDLLLLSYVHTGVLTEEKCERLMDQIDPDRGAMRKFAIALADDAPPAAPAPPPARRAPAPSRPRSRHDAALRLVQG